MSQAVWKKHRVHPKFYCSQGYESYESLWQFVVPSADSPEPLDLKTPRYTLDATAHREHSQLREYLESIPNCVRLEAGAPLMPGDLVTFIMGRAPHHIGMIVTPPVFIHSMRGLGTTFGQLNDPTYSNRKDTVYRLLEL